jgi:hypothetical protein
MWLEKVSVAQGGTAQNIAFGLSGQGLPATIQVGIYNDDGSGYGPATLLGKSQPQSVGSGRTDVDVPNICLSPGIYWMAIGVPSNGVSIGLFGNTQVGGGEIFYYNYFYFPSTYPNAYGLSKNGITPLTVTVSYCY